MAEEEDDANELAAMKEKLLEAKSLVTGDDKKSYPLCVGEAAFKRVRNQTAALLKIVDPKSHATYRKMKAEDNASLAARRKAYVWAFERVCEHLYNVPGL